MLSKEVTTCISISQQLQRKEGYRYREERGDIEEREEGDYKDPCNNAGGPEHQSIHHQLTQTHRAKGREKVSARDEAQSTMKRRLLESEKTLRVELLHPDVRVRIQPSQYAEPSSD